MLTNEDIQKLIEANKEVFSTKENFEDFRGEMRKNMARLLTLEEFDGFRKEIKQDFSSLLESLQSLAVSVDKLAKSVADLHEEYTAITAKIDRNEKWIQQLANKFGVKLEY